MPCADPHAVLYDDTFRFFYELIQNADDAFYDKAANENAPPCIDFKVQEKQMIVDLNEDGFNLANVLAICSTGQSSKADNSETNHSRIILDVSNVFTAHW